MGESMYMSILTVNAICPTPIFSYGRKYVHVDSDYKRHMSDTESLL